MASSRLSGDARSLRLVVFLATLFCPAAWATDNQAAWGQYSGECPLGRVAFKMDENGISRVSLNGVKRSNAELKTYGRFDFVEMYGFDLVRPGITASVNLMVLFDDEDRFAQATGFYFETKQVLKGTGQMHTFTRACTLRFTFRPSPEQ